MRDFGWNGRPGEKRAELRFEEEHCRRFLALGRVADLRAGSAQPLRIRAVAASPPDRVYTRIVAVPQATAEPLGLSIPVPSAWEVMALAAEGLSNKKMACFNEGGSRS
jgi:hypothetical protein